MILSSTSPVTELSLIYQKVNQERMPKGFHKGLCISMMDAIVLKQYKKEHVKQLDCICSDYSEKICGLAGVSHNLHVSIWDPPV